MDLPGIVETQEVRLSSKVGGRVERVLVREGERVASGQSLVELDCEELQAKRSQLIALQEAAQAKWDLLFNGPLPEQIAASRSAVDSAEARLARLVAGWRVEEVEMAKLDMETWKAEYERARSEFERLSSVRNKDSVSPSDIDAAKAAMLKSESQYKSVTSRLNMLINGTRPEEISEARAELAKMKANYDLIQRGTRDEELRIAKAQVAEVTAKIQELDVMIKESVITAPRDCLIEVVSVRRGDVALPNQPVLRVLYDEDLWVKAYVPETELSRIRLNQSVTIQHDGSKTEHRGTISQIANVSEFTPRNVQSPEERHHQVFAIKVRIEESNADFKSGMAARVRIPHSAVAEN
jgi:multidrug resistance efflux pump